jgi:phosphate:Na+ symporter
VPAPVSNALVSTLGGLGLFLLGMVVMTEGLRGLASRTLRRSLTRFTRSPLSGAVTGAASTALVQSSSAVTVAAVGFVGAGLLTFPQALGVILGANLGTTVTGWLVALLGFKLQIGSLALPLVLAGALLRLMGRERAADAGYGLAGFGLVFVGISALQQGMAGLEGLVTPSSFPPDTLVGRAQLLVLGLALTLVTQSSSAGVVTALVAVHAGAIALPQALAMVVGMDVGTTVSALLATIGGSTAARRTGLAHVTYNLFAGSGGFLLISPYLAAWHWLAPEFVASDPEIVLVAFHSSYNALGVCIAVPSARRFGDLMLRLVPERLTPFARRLDRSLLVDPAVAIQATIATLRDLAEKTLDVLEGLIDGDRSRAARADRLALLSLALAETRRYVECIATSSEMGETYQRHVSAMHTIDHLDRVLDRCKERHRWRASRADPQLLGAASRLAATVAATRSGLAGASDGPPEAPARATWEDFETRKRPYREAVLRRAVAGEIDAAAALECIDVMRHLRRTAYHLWRIVHHLRRARLGAPLEEREAVPPHAEASPAD